MSNQVYRKKEFIVIPVSRGYVVINTSKPFEFGHTHIKNYGACQRIIHWCLNKKVPKESSDYILTSLIRISDDPVYKEKLQELIDTRQIKGHKPKCIK